jgi:hypothetical protein
MRIMPRIAYRLRSRQRAANWAPMPVCTQLLGT